MSSINSSRPIAAALESQRAFYDAGGTRKLTDRLEALRRLEKVIVKNESAILGALKQDLNKPDLEAYLAEYHFLLEEIRLTCRSLKKWLKPRRAKNPFFFLPARSWVQREAHGITLILSPWNYPIQLSLAPMISAVAAGNTAILKPSEMAPASESLIARLIEESFPPEHVQVILGDSQVAQNLLEQDFDFIFFTGSTEIGRLVARHAAETLTPCVLELGGKCPCIVDASADLALTARRLLGGKFLNAGQTCVSPDFAAVHESVQAEFLEELKRMLRDTPWQQDLSSIINRKHYERLQGLLRGDEIRTGEDKPENLQLAPRIQAGVDWEDPIMQEEIFGPILPVLTWSKPEELIRQLKRLPSPLALYCFSSNQDFVQKLIDQIDSGSVCINDTMKQAVNLNLPFGGVKGSGYGRYRGKTGVETFTYERSFTRRYFVKDPFETLPPYSSKLDQLKKWLK